jgi:hypothetical protein
VGQGGVANGPLGGLRTRCGRRLTGSRGGFIVVDMRRRRYVFLLSALPLLVLVLGVVATIIWWPGRIEQVYSVSSFVSTGPYSRAQPGDTVLVRGVLSSYTDVSGTRWSLTQMMPGIPVEIEVALGSTTPLLSALQRIPFVRPLLPPAPDNPITGKLMVYRLVYVGCSPCSYRSEWQHDNSWQLASGGQ